MVDGSSFAQCSWKSTRIVLLRSANFPGKGRRIRWLATQKRGIPIGAGGTEKDLGSKKQNTGQTRLFIPSPFNNATVVLNIQTRILEEEDLYTIDCLINTVRGIRGNLPPPLSRLLILRAW